MHKRGDDKGGLKQPSGQIVIGPPSARSKRRCRPEIGGDVVPCTAVSAGQCVGPTAVSQSGRRRADVGSRRQNDSRLGIGTSSSERRRHDVGTTSAPIYRPDHRRYVGGATAAQIGEVL